MIDRIAVEIDREAVIVTADQPLTVVSSAPVGGGFVSARAIANVHVPKGFGGKDLDAVVADFARRRALPGPLVGLITAAWTEKAKIATETDGPIVVTAIATVGLGNLAAAGVHTAARPGATVSTINVVVVADADVDAAALVNCIATVTEVKTAVLIGAGMRCADGQPATGTSTDAVVVAATGRGTRCRFGGPVSVLGALVARTARRVLTRGVERWIEEHRIDG